MKHGKALCRFLSALLFCALLAGGALAAQPLTLDAEAATCLSEETFSGGASALNGIYVSAVPSASLCEIRYGARAIRAGDVLPVSALSALNVTPTGSREGECSLCYRPIYSNGIGIAQELKMSLLRGKNQAPAALDSSLETYKNIQNSGTLSVTDPDGDALSFTLVREPKRGSVTLHADGTFTYTPQENKVGKDSFTYTATDAAGNVSNEACVRIKIVRPTDRAVYSDLPDEAQYLAVWLREKGVYSGRTVAGNCCFAPDEPLSRGEFLVMAMALFDEAPEEAALTSGFADEQTTPVWMRPYIVAALRSGVISGGASEDGVVFRPTDTLTRAEAAVMVQALARLPQSDAQSVFSEESDSPLPVWAVRAVDALECAGVSFDVSEPDAPLTRLEAASLLSQVYPLRAENTQNAQ